MTDIRRYMTLVETAQHPDVERIREIATRYRDEMERDGWEMARGDWEADQPAYRGHYRSFTGTCEFHAADLAQRLIEAGYPAQAMDGIYEVSDPAYHDENERLAWETHHWVAVPGWRDPDALLVDVTADQFHPSNPSAYRVVVTTWGDPHYRR